jgi:outer membrane protein assembly factor BamB
MTLNKTILGTILAAVLVAAALHGQVSRSRIHSRPAVPSAEALRRLNLVVAWKTYVPMDGSRDGIIRTELVDRDLYVLTRSGIVARFDAETGKPLWRTRVGKPYTLLPFIAVNSRSVYAIANVEAFGLDRDSGVRKWQYPIRSGISAAPAVDVKQVYVPLVDTRLVAYSLPFVSVADVESGEGYSPVYGTREEVVQNQPVPVWEELTNAILSFQPLKASKVIFIVGRGGQVFGFSKRVREGSLAEYEFSLEGKVRVPQGQFGDTAYVATEDASLHSINMNTGRLRWRHVSGSPVTRKPVALDKDLFVTSETEGMARLDRASGESQWKVPRGRGFVETNYDADRFLAANNRFVYATDHSNRLLVLDRKRGVRLSMLDTRAFHVPIVNEVTDRLYLAANDGVIVCLRDRDLPTPIRHRMALEEAGTELRKVLSRPITVPASPKPIQLVNVLEKMEKDYKPFQFELYRVRGDREIRTPAATKEPLGKYLQRILTPLNATFEIEDETVLIIPGKPR